MSMTARLLGYAVCGGLVLGASLQVANAACATAPGTWHFFASENSSDQAHAIACVLTIGSDGKFSSAPCKAYQAGKSSLTSKTVHGSITLTECEISGSIAIPGDTSVSIKAGHINDNIGAGIAVQGTGSASRVLNFQIVKE